MWEGMPQGREARAALATSWLLLSYLLVQVVASMSWQVGLTADGVRHGVGVVLAVGLIAVFVRIQAQVLRRRNVRALTWVAVGVVVLGFLLLPLSDAWATAGVSLATLMLCFRPWVVITFGTLLTGGMVLLLAERGSSAVALVGIPMIVWLAAAVIVVLTRMVMVLEELRAAREHLARLRIDEERDRISRELHDILGRTLVAASLRAQTALRLVDQDVDRCRSQLDELGRTLSDGQAQLRVLVRGQALIGLDTEIATARDLFGQLGIECQVVDERTAEDDVSPAEAVDEVRMLAAGVLREAVTNMLKHSTPRTVVVQVRDRAGARELRIVNDGVRAEEAGGSGTGLRELASRVDAAGGVLTTELSDSGTFVVEARLPFDGETGRVTAAETQNDEAPSGSGAGHRTGGRG